VYSIARVLCAFIYARTAKTTQGVTLCGCGVAESEEMDA
jgi:hypothetical protein